MTGREYVTPHALERWRERAGKDELALWSAMRNARLARRVKHRKYHRTDEAEYYTDGRWVFVVLHGVVITVHCNEKGVVR